MNRRHFIKTGALFVPTIFIPRPIRAQSVLTADGLAAFGSPAPSGGGGGGGDITTGLIAWYQLNENAANTTVSDSSGNGSDGTSNANTSVLHVVGHIGSGAFLLNGSSQYVQLPNSIPSALNTGTQMSMGGWFKGSAIQSMIRIQPDGSHYAILGWGTSSPQCIMSNDGSTSGVAIAGVQDGNWHHVFMTWKKNTTNGFKVYVDGSLSAQRNSSNNSLSLSPIDFPTIGRYNGASPGEYTNGTVDDVRIYNIEKTAVDVTAIYNYA